ncbi:MAG: YwiC-like family protein [Acidobacteriia bacterium]|nr:YwiC-like family protein [Terriglobia bacterium]
MLLIPWAVGCGVARRWSEREFLLLAGMLMFFLAQAQIMNRLRMRFAITPDPRALVRVQVLFILFALLGTLAVVPLLAVYHLKALVYFGGVALVLTAISMVLVIRKLDRSLAGQILASAGLSMSAPLAYYVAAGTVDHLAMELWMINFLFFLGGVFYVQLKIDALPRASRLRSLADRFRFAGGTMGLNVVILSLVLLTLRVGSLSPFIILAFVPTFLQAIIGTIRLDRPAKLKRVGIISTVHSIVFAVLVILLA